MGGMAVAMTSGVGVTWLVGLGKLVAGEGVFGSAVGAFPTGLITFLRYVFATSYRHATRLLRAGICNNNITRIRNPAPANKMFLLDMRVSVPKLDESTLIHIHAGHASPYGDFASVTYTIVPT